MEGKRHFVARRFLPASGVSEEFGAYDTQGMACQTLVERFKLGPAAKMSFRRWGSYRNYTASVCLCDDPSRHATDNT